VEKDLILVQPWYSMAKHSNAKKAWQTIEVSQETDLTSGITASDLVKDQLTDDVADDNFIATSLDLTWTSHIEQAAEPGNIGPLLFGVAKSDYSDAEIEAWVENPSGFTRANLIQQEISARHIKLIGQFSYPSLAPSEVAGKVVSKLLNDGLPIHTRLNWRILEGQSLSLWVYNAGNADVVATSGQDVTVFGKINGFWED